MIEKIRLGGEWGFKKWFAAIIFGAIIAVFALWGINPNNMGGDALGVAATVNDVPISVAEFRNRSEQVEQNAKGRFDGLPETQRRAMTKELRRRVLDQLVLTEAVYQAAKKAGVSAADADVKDQILQISFLQDKGRFLGERYRQWLQNMSLSAEQFERQIRKDVVTQKLQQLFVGASAPTREEVRRSQALSLQKLSLRFAELTHDDMKKLDNTSEKEVQAYLGQHQKEIEAYYNDNKIEYTTPETYHARDLLIRVDQKRTDAEALKVAQELKSKINAKNFASMATSQSEDPTLKSKGGDLGPRQKGSLLPEYESVALALKPGEVSAPVKIENAYHLILLESKTDGGTKPLKSVETEVARRLISRSKETEILDRVRKVVEAGDKAEIDRLLTRAQVKWQDTGEFDLSVTAIPKLGDGKQVMPEVLKQAPNLGLVKHLISHNGNSLIVALTEWKKGAGQMPEVDGMDRMLAYKKAEGAIDTWAKRVKDTATIQENTRLLQ